MNVEWQPPEVPADLNDPRIQAALSELKQLILRYFPDAKFAVSYGEDPLGIYLKPEVDIQDLDEVEDVFISRLVDMQGEEGLPAYVIPVWPMARITAYLREHDPRRQSEGAPQVALG